MKDNIVGNLGAKVVGLFLLCFFGACIVFNSLGLSYLMSYSYPDGLQSYRETADCKYLLEDEVYRIFQSYDNSGADTVESIYQFGDYTNVSYSLDEYNTSLNQYTNLSYNDKEHENAHEDSYEFYIVKENKDYSVYLDRNLALTRSVETNTSLYRMTCSLKNPFTAHDSFYKNNTLFDKFYFQGERNLFNKILIEVVLFIFVLIFEFSAAGHKNGIEGIHLLWIDKIPYEIVTMFALFPLLFVSGTGLSYSAFETEDWIFGIYFFIGIAMVISLFLYMLLMTTARRIKANCFITSFITYKIFSFIMYILKALPVVYKFSIPVFLFFIFEINLAGRFFNGRTFYAQVFLLLCISLAIVLVAYEFSILFKAGNELASGNRNYKIEKKNINRMFGEMKEHAIHLNEIGNGISAAVDKEMKSERLKAELITNVSHDIKTPLTSIINYTDLLEKDHTQEEEKQYLEVLNRQSNKLKKLIEDLVEASKASTGNICTKIIPLNIRELMEQSIAEYSDKFSESLLEPVLTIKDEPVMVLADGRLLWRVLSNLFSNVSKYALSGTRVYIDVQKMNGNYVQIAVKNISKEALNINPDELTERFVRGDSSRHTEGSGLGLNIVKSLVEVQKGKFSINIDGDLFKAIVELPLVNEKEK